MHNVDFKSDTNLVQSFYLATNLVQSFTRPHCAVKSHVLQYLSTHISYKYHIYAQCSFKSDL